MESSNFKTKSLNKIYNKLAKDRLNQEFEKINSDLRIKSIEVDEEYSIDGSVMVTVDYQNDDDYNIEEQDAYVFYIFVVLDWPSKPHFFNFNHKLFGLTYQIQSILLELTFYIETENFKLNTMFVDVGKNEIDNTEFESTGERTSYNESIDNIIHWVKENEEEESSNNDDDSY